MDSIATAKGGRRFVQLADKRKGVIDSGRLHGFTLFQAKIYLDALPDRSAK